MPVSIMKFEDLLSTYKYGKTYYQIHMTLKKDIDEPSHNVGWQDNVEETKPNNIASRRRLR